MAKFLTITQACSKDRLTKHDIMHHINTTGPPVSAYPQRLAPKRVKIAPNQFKHTVGCHLSEQVGTEGVQITEMYG